jgi:hypothetical protein
MVLAGLAIAAGLLVPAGVASAATPAPAHPAATARVALKVNGCPVGDACMYTLNGWHGGQGGHPEHIYTYDHCFVLHNELGHRWIFNLQRDAEKVKGYTSRDCSGTRTWVVPAVPPGFIGIAKEEPITPINSIRLG